MQTWMHLSGAALPALPLATGALALALLNALDEAEPLDDTPSWRDDPTVLAMLTGMSL